MMVMMTKKKKKKWGTAFTLAMLHQIWKASPPPGTSNNAITTITLPFLSPKPNPIFGFHFAAALSTRTLGNNVNKLDNVEDCLGLYNHMIRVRPLPNILEFNRLLGRIVKLKSYSSAISLFKDLCLREGLSS